MTLTSRSRWVAGITVRAVINIPANARVVRIRACLAVGVAVDAGKDGEVGWVRVTISTGRPGAGVMSRVNGESGVVHPRSRPACGGMTLRTIRGKAGRHVIGIGDGSEFGSVTSVAVCGGPGVTAPDVAVRANYRDVRPGQREPCGVVIEVGRSPRGGRMADLALLGVARLDMVGIGGGVVVVQVAGDASCAETGISAADVAVGADDRDVRPGQREAGAGVVECRS